MSAITIMSEEELLQTAAIPAKKTKEICWHNHQITIKEQITFREYLALIQRILDDSERDGNVTYETVDFATRVNIVGSFAFIDLPKDIQKLYDIMYGTDLYNCIVAEIKQWQFDRILEVIQAYTGVRGGKI